jgi:hypothetical protein
MGDPRRLDLAEEIQSQEQMLNRIIDQLLSSSISIQDFKVKFADSEWRLPASREIPLSVRLYFAVRNRIEKHDRFEFTEADFKESIRWARWSIYSGERGGADPMPDPSGLVMVRSKKADS